MSKSLSSKQVKRFSRELTRYVGGQLVDKRKAAEMKFIAMALDFMGVMDSEKFMKDFAITIGNSIYLPFTPGVVSKKWSLPLQIMIIGHECQHVRQFDNDRKFAFRYLGSRSRRANYEADALHVNQEIFFYLHGRPCPVSVLINPLRHYMLRPSDLKVTRKNLELYNRIVKMGLVGTRVGKKAIKILKSV